MLIIKRIVVLRGDNGDPVNACEDIVDLEKSKPAAPVFGRLRKTIPPKSKLLWVYIAAPYTLPEPVENTNRAVKMANRFVSCGFHPIVPHLTLAWNLITPAPAQFWYDYTMELMLRCDVVYRMKGASVGADKEVQTAVAAGIPVFYEADGVNAGNLLQKLGEFKRGA